MYNTVRTCARPPQIVRRPRRVPLSQLRGATPTKAAICCRVSVPNSGSSSSNVRAHTGPMPGALCNRSSFSRHSGLARSSVSRSSSSVARRSLSQVIWASMSFCEALARPREAVLLRGPHDQSVAGGAPAGRAAPASGRPAAGGASGGSRRQSGPGRAHPTPPSWPTGPVARAKSRACRGLHDDDGQARRGQRGRGGPLQAAGGFQHNQGGVEGLQPFHERHDSTGIVRDGPALPGGAHGNIQLGFGDINTDKAWHVNSYELLSARPCRYGLNGTRQLYGLEESRT